MPPVDHTDLVGLHRGLLHDWGEDTSAHARAFGEALAEQPLTAPLVMGAIAGVASMLAARDHAASAMLSLSIHVRAAHTRCRWPVRWCSISIRAPHQQPRGLEATKSCSVSRMDTT